MEESINMKLDNKYLCDRCNKELDAAFESEDKVGCEDPYSKEINEEIVITDFCEACYEERLLAI